MAALSPTAGASGASILPSGTPSEGAIWGYAIAGALVLAVGVEEVPKIGVPLVILLLVVMLLSWKGWSS